MYFFIIFLYSSCTTGLVKLGFKFSDILGLKIFLIAYFFISIFILSRICIWTLKYHKTITDKIKKYLNVYVLFSLFLTAVIVTSGIDLLAQQYPSKLPFDKDIFQVHYNDHTKYEEFGFYDLGGINPPKIDCRSDKSYNDFVEGDRLICITNVSYKKDFYISDIKMIAYHVNGSKINLNRTHSCGYTIRVYEIPLDNDYEFIDTRFLISDKNDFREWHLPHGSLEFKPIISQEEYFSRERSKTTLLITIFSIALFSSVIAVKNLRDLIEHK